MSKKVTCGILIKTDKGFLLCHPSGRGYDKGCYDIPKGCKEEGETEFNCMARELKEETGLIIPSEQFHYIEDLGRYRYTKEKDIHLFYAETHKIDATKLYCSSELDNGNKEHDSFLMTEDLEYCFRSLQNIFRLKGFINYVRKQKSEYSVPSSQEEVVRHD